MYLSSYRPHCSPEMRRVALFCALMCAIVFARGKCSVSPKNKLNLVLFHGSFCQKNQHDIHFFPSLGFNSAKQMRDTFEVSSEKTQSQMKKILKWIRDSLNRILDENVNSRRGVLKNRQWILVLKQEPIRCFWAKLQLAQFRTNESVLIEAVPFSAIWWASTELSH